MAQKEITTTDWAAYSKELYKNAILSLELGVEDRCISEIDSKRIISSARNFDAGVCLLIKSKMAEGKEEVRRKHFGDLKEFLKGLKFDVAIIDALHEYRNKVEHEYSSAQLVTATQYLAYAFAWIVDFMKRGLEKDPQGEFSPGVWRYLMSMQEIYEVERCEMEDAVSELDLPDLWLNDMIYSYFKCPKCASMIVLPCKGEGGSEILFKCRVCGEAFDLDGIQSALCERCICLGCGHPLEGAFDLEVFSQTGMCGGCEHNYSKDD